jgi:hypothetical protein
VAPNLTALVREIVEDNRSDIVADYPTAAAELRAMTNALRVAARERRAVLEVARYGRTCHQGEIDGDWIGRMLEDSDERLACALLRLERLSRGGRKA